MNKKTTNLIAVILIPMALFLIVKNFILDGDLKKQKHRAVPAQVVDNNASMGKLNRIGTLQKPEIPEIFSAWKDTKKDRFKKILLAQQNNVVVIPFVKHEGRKISIDTIGNSLMTRFFVDALQNNTDLKVADYETVRNSLLYAGEPLTKAKVDNYVANMQPDIYISGFVSSDIKNIMDVVIQVHKLNSNGKYTLTATRNWNRISYSDELPPYQMFNKILPEIIAKLNLVKNADSKDVSAPVNAQANDELILPETPKRLYSDHSFSLKQKIYNLQLLGLLYPETSITERRKLFERSLFYASKINLQDSDRALFISRALYYLERRPAAISVLKGNKSVEGEAFQKYMDGDYNNLIKILPSIEKYAHEIMSRIELNDLAYSYSKFSDDNWLKQLTTLYPEWSPLFIRKLKERDIWFAKGSDVSVKLLLDKYYPVPGQELQSVINSASLKQSDAVLELILLQSIAYHVETVLQTLNTNEFTRIDASITKYDVVTFLDNVAQFNIIKRIEMLLDTKGLPDAAIELVNGALEVYDGHTHLLFHKFRALASQAEKIHGIQKSNKLRRASKLLVSAVSSLGSYDKSIMRYEFDILKFFSKLQTLENLNQHITYTGYVSALLKKPLNVYPIKQSNLGKKDSLTQLKYTNDNLQYLINSHSLLKASNPIKASELLTENSHRFHGHPDLKKFIAMSSDKSGGGNPVFDHYREVISEGGLDWEAYYSIGRNSVLDGNYKEAMEIFLKYPGFRKSTHIERVTLSNYAYQSGSLLFWHGAISQSIELYELSSSFNTGSEAEITSLARLAIIKGDYKQATKLMAERAKRYHTVYAYRDFLSLLHITGYSKDAWGIFENVVTTIVKPQLWVSALVGHRIAGTQADDFEKWITRKTLLVPTVNNNNLTWRYALMFLLMDRPASDKHEKMIKQITDSSVYRVAPSPKGSSVRINFIKGPNGVSYSVSSNYKNKNIKLIAGERLPHEYTLFARGYNAIKNKEFRKAYDALYKLGAFYNLYKIISKDYHFSYLARSAVKIGDTQFIENGLGKDMISLAQNKKEPPFDFYLAKAYLSAGKNDHKAAIIQLKKAFAYRPYTGHRPIMTWYQLLEACEWLYQDSGYAGYKKLLLMWAKQYQVIAPMYAFSYAFEAKYTDDPKRKIRALGITLYLDKDSVHLQGITETDIDAARKWFSESEPFKNIKTIVSS
jgi:hypothetical protein